MMMETGEMGVDEGTNAVAPDVGIIDGERTNGVCIIALESFEHFGCDCARALTNLAPEVSNGGKGTNAVTFDHRTVDRTLAVFDFVESIDTEERVEEEVPINCDTELYPPDEYL